MVHGPVLELALQIGGRSVQSHILFQGVVAAETASIGICSRHVPGHLTPAASPPLPSQPDRQECHGDQDLVLSA